MIMTAPQRDKRLVSLLWATIDHADALSKCHASLFPEPWSADSFRQFLSHPGSATLVARHGPDQEMAGFIVAQLAADEAEILTFGVAKDWQRQGIGMRLLEGLQRAATRGEAKKLFLEVGEDNLPALVLYSRMGFKEAGRRKGYYKKPDGSAVDALNLMLPLNAA
jgi:[ribosomal protein S18]-alanine N-acetyltransferase